MAQKAVGPEGEGDGMGGLEHQRVGAAVAAGSDDDLRVAVAGGGHRPHVPGCQVGHIGGQDEDFGGAAPRGVGGSLGQGRVELPFRPGVIGAAGGWRGSAWLAFFGERVAAGAFGSGERAAVAADDEDLGVKLGLVDGGESAGEQFAVEGAALLGRDTGGQAAFAFVEGFDGDNCPQGHFRNQWLESGGWSPMDTPCFSRFMV